MERGGERGKLGKKGEKGTLFTLVFRERKQGGRGKGKE